MIYPRFRFSGWIFAVAFVVFCLIMDKPLSHLLGKLCRGHDKLETFLTVAIVFLAAAVLTYVLSAPVMQIIEEFVGYDLR